MKMLHQPVLLEEVKAMFADSELKVFFDGTLGFGGHAEMFLSTHPEIELYIGCDRDPNAIAYAKERLKKWEEKIVFINENFSEVDQILDKLNVDLVDGFFLT